MKHKILFLPLICFVLSGCTLLNFINKKSGSSESGSSNNGSNTSEPGGDTSDPHSIQNMNILHAWNWKLNDIKSRLSAIKSAGYGAVQISPMQPKVDKNGWADQSTKSQWWKLYQPLAFKVAESGETFLGTKSELTSLCSEAKKQDIKIVVDVVTNHLAGSGNSYSSQVYKQYPLHNWSSGADDNNGESVVKGNIGLPDLDTSNSQVQQDVLAMLKSYIDCGVSGFRFDAAKHIETPDDGSYASNYWPTVLNGTTEYAKNKKVDAPYYYGEILNTCGAGRSFESYTKLMSMCDNKQGTSVINAVNSKSISSLKSTYDTGVNPNHLVLWAESHDTYANDSGYDLTRDISIDSVNKAYIIQASRKDAATLYFARPTDLNVTICSINDNSGWKNKEISAVNKFHAQYVGAEESINNNNNCFVNVRGNGSSAGAVIVNINASNSANVEVKGLANGAYTDLISGNTFNVSNEKVNATFTSGACILVPKK